MKLIGLCFFIYFGFSQHISQIDSFDAFGTINDGEFYMAWELPMISEQDGSLVHGYFNTKSGGKKVMFKTLATSPKNQIVMVFFNGKDKVESVYMFRAENSSLKLKDKNIYWLGKQEVNKSYAFTKSLLQETNEKEALYGLLNIHQKHDETLSYYTERYKKTRSEEEKKSFIFWIGQTKTEKALPFLNDIYKKADSEELQEKVIFAYFQNETKASQLKLIQIAKNDTDMELRKKAIFWLSQLAQSHMEHFFNELIYSEDEVEIKNAAIFALYQKGLAKELENIVESAKDVRLRKKALFWLGQLGDQQSVSVIEKILDQN